MPYLSTFSPGFESTVRRILPSLLPSSSVTDISVGMAIYRYGGKPGTLASVPIFNNSFHIINQFSGQPSFSEMTDTVFRSKNSISIKKSLNFHTKTFGSDLSGKTG